MPAAGECPAIKVRLLAGRNNFLQSHALSLAESLKSSSSFEENMSFLKTFKSKIIYKAFSAVLITIKPQDSTGYLA